MSRKSLSRWVRGDVGSSDEDICPYVASCLILSRPAALSRHAHFPYTSSRLHRLDARPGLRADVPDALLRLLAESRGPQDDVLHVVATGWDSAGAAVSLSGGNFVCPGDRQAATEGPGAERDRAHHHPARRGNSWAWVFCSACRNTSSPGDGLRGATCCAWTS